MNCREAEEYIFAERDGALDDTRHAALASHLQECAGCRRVRNDLEAFVATWRGADAAVRVPDADIEWHKLRRALNRSPERAHVSWTRWIAIPGAVAAAAAIALYVAPDRSGAGLHSNTGTVVARHENATASSAAAASTVVYVDDKSGWTFVWEPDTAANGQHI